MIAILLPLVLWSGLKLHQFNTRPHPTGKTWCQRHLIDDHPVDENGKEIEPKEYDDDENQR